MEDETRLVAKRWESGSVWVCLWVCRMKTEIESTECPNSAEDGVLFGKGPIRIGSWFPPRTRNLGLRAIWRERGMALWLWRERASEQASWRAEKRINVESAEIVDWWQLLTDRDGSLRIRSLTYLINEPSRPILGLGRFVHTCKAWTCTYPPLRNQDKQTMEQTMGNKKDRKKHK